MTNIQHNFGKDITALVFFLAAGFVVAQIVSAGILYAQYGKNAMDVGALLANASDNLNTVRTVQMIASILCFGAPALLFSRYKKQHLFGYAFASKPANRLLWLLAPLLVLTIYPFLNVLYMLNQKSFLGNIMVEQQEQYQLFVEALLSPKTVGYFLFNFLVIAILPAVVEEAFFRGAMQRLFAEKWNIHIAVSVTALVFSLIHFEFSAFLPRVFLGMLLGYVFYFSGNIWLAIFMHLFNNGKEITLMYLKNTGIIEGKLSDAPAMPPVSELLAYSILFVILGVVFYYRSKKEK